MPPVPVGGVVPIHVTIDPIACDAYGFCAELLPEAITLDEWGHPIVDKLPISDTHLAEAKRAVRDCPRNAITLTIQHGEPRTFVRSSSGRTMDPSSTHRATGRAER